LVFEALYPKLSVHTGQVLKDVLAQSPPNGVR